MKFFRVILMDDEWTMYLAPAAEDVLLDEENDAEIDLEAKEIYFRANKTDIVDVRHEMFHLYMDYCFVGTANLEQDQMEEVSCELFAHRGPLMLQKADEIYAKLQELKHASQD